MSSDRLEQTQMEKSLGEWIWDRKQEKQISWVQEAMMWR